MHRFYEVSKLLAVFILCISSGYSYANGPASVHFDLNECTSYTSNMTNADYSEFTAIIQNSDQIQMSVIGNHLYRNNPFSNPHSCTPGVNGTEGMCVGYDLDCNFSPGSSQSVRFDIAIDPITDEEVSLTRLNFYEKSPIQFDWIDGISGPNNYPQFYGIRVLQGTNILYEQSGITTNPEWTLQNFNFTGIDGFTVSEATIFNFELIAYCPIDNGASQNVWDVDEISIVAECGDDNCQAEGGTLTGGPFEFCVGDDVADNLAPGSIALSGNSGANSQWVVTDENGMILGLPPIPSAVNFDGAGPGTCLVWHLSYEAGISGLAAGNNASDLTGCFNLSNPISVIRYQPEGGTLTGGPFEFCVGDGVADNLAPGSINLSGNSGPNSQWVVTDENGNILGLPPMPSAVDFDGAGSGTCLVWHLSFADGLQGATVGSNAADLQGCYSLSNPISVVRTQPEGGTLSGGPFEFCVGDGVADNLAPGQIVLSGNSGSNSQWVVTDESGMILGLPPMPSAVDFDGAGSGTCLVWHLSFEDGLQGAAVGNNAADLEGCYSLSNPISVVRNEAVGGTLVGGPFEFCVGDGVADNLAPGSITLSGNSGANSQWVVTDESGMILGLPPMPSAVDFDGAGSGTCLVWHLSYADGLSGLAAGNNAANLQGCFSLSNPISVVRNQPEGGTLSGGPFEFCVGDGVADNLAPGSITLSGNSGSNSQWVVTDENGNILGLPPMPSAVDFDGAGSGTCLVWHLSFEDGLQGAAVGNNAADLEGCYSLSNPISVVRNEAVGGTLAGGPFEFCVGDGVADNLAPGSITLSGNSGANSQWVVTDESGMILGLPPMPSAVDFDGAGSGTCLVWHLSYADGLVGLAAGNNAANLQGCFSLSNPISVVRNQPEGGTLSGGPFSFIVGDGIADNIQPGQIVLAGNSGSNSQWVVTDDQGMILGLPPMPSAVDFDGAGVGTCLVWHLSFEDGLTGATVGSNASDLQGCYSLSNPITVIRSEMTAVSGGTITGGPFEFCVGDGVADNLAPGSITLSGNTGMNSQWVVTDDQGMILGLPPMPSVVDFDEAGSGTCLIWHLSFQDGLTGAAVGNNAMTDLVGNFSLSNSIAVVRYQPEGGTLSGGPFSFTVGDGISDNLAPGSITLTGNSGSNSQWVVTDDQGMILGLPPMPSAVDFEGAGVGTCLVWHLSFEDGLTGAIMGNNAMTDLQGCYSLSNPISVVRTGMTPVSGGTITGGPFEFCVGDGVADNLAAGSITLSGNTGMNSQWVVTDDQGMILGLPPMPSAVDFDGAGAGTCLIWHLSFQDGLTGAAVGNNAMTDLVGDFSLSNSIAVVRNQPEGGTLTGGPFSFTVGDGISDNLAPGSITLAGNSGSNSQWVVTDDQGMILGLPPMPSAVDFEGAGEGTCLVWHLSFEDGLTGAIMGNNAMTDLVGCYSLSNPISVVREAAVGCQAAGGDIIGGPFTFTEVGDGMPDMIPAGSITLANNSGMNSQWVVTDSQGNILGLPPMPGAVDFDGAGSGACLIWHLSFDDGLTGAVVGNNALTDLVGCYSLSNSIEVIRENADGCQANGGELFGGPFTFTEIGDGVQDTIAVDSITLANSSGMNSQWVVTDSQGIILGLPPTPSAVNFDGAGSGTCLIWHLSFDDGLTGAVVGNNAMTDLVGCYSLSNSIEVIRENASGCQANGGELFGGPFTFTEVGDGVPDMIPAGSITLANNSGMNGQWVVTDVLGEILGLPPMPGAVDFDGAGVGTCLIWYLSYDDGLTGLAVGNNALTDLVGCHSLSANSITVERSGTAMVADSIVINEIFGGNLVEIKNVGTTTIDISSWFLCDFPNYTQMQNLVINCGGDLILDPMEIVTVEYDIISTVDGELGLYKTNQYSNPTEIIDYVEWGSTGHQRSSVAVAAGIWTAGDFVNGWNAAMSLEYDGAGNTSMDWIEDAHTPCIENDLLVPNETPGELFTFKIYPNPSSDRIELLSVYEFDLKTSYMIYNALGAIIYEGKMDAFQSDSFDISDLEEGTYYIMMMSKYGRTTKSFVKIN